ncbi:Pygopus [Homalodisca vitripennis]|nr:Pygopus [Homalodisca vitripennis]
MATPIKYPCGVCLREVTERQQGIKCDDFCGRWFHRDCVKISKAEYDRLAADQSLKWECLRSDCEDENKKPINILISQMAGFAYMCAPINPMLRRKIMLTINNTNNMKEECVCCT